MGLIKLLLPGYDDSRGAQKAYNSLCAFEITKTQVRKSA